MFFVKRRTKCPDAKYRYKSWPIIFTSCVGVKNFFVKIFFTSAKSLLIFSEGTVYVCNFDSVNDCT